MDKLFSCFPAPPSPSRLTGFMDHITVAKDYAGLVTAPGLSLKERIKCAASSVLHALPIAGQIVTYCEKKSYEIAQAKPVPVLDLRHLEDPYEIGKAHGTSLRPQIQKLYKVIFPMIAAFAKEYGRDALALESILVDKLPSSIKKELQGLAEGAGVPHEEVILANTFLSVFPEKTACSAVGLTLQEDLLHVCSLGNEGAPYDKLTQAAKSTLDVKESIKVTGSFRTIQTMIFNPSKGILSVSRAETDATQGVYHDYDVSEPATDTEGPTVARNLDWDMKILAMHTLLLRRGKTTSVTFPGFIGCLSMINEAGVHCSYHQNLEKSSAVDFLRVHEVGLSLYEFLKTVRSAEELKDRTISTPFAGSFHLMLGDKRSYFSLSHKAHFQKITMNRFSIHLGEIFPTPDAYSRLKATYLREHPELSEDTLTSFIKLFPSLSFSLVDKSSPEYEIFLSLTRISNTYETLYSRLLRFHSGIATQAIGYHKYLLLEKAKCLAPAGTVVVDFEKAIIDKYHGTNILRRLSQKIRLNPRTRFSEIWVDYAGGPHLITDKLEGHPDLLEVANSLPEFYASLTD